MTHSSVPLSAPDFRILFESAPGLYLVLTPDFTIVAMSDAYGRATKTKREEILGRRLFDVFPVPLEDSAATAECNLRASLERVLRDRIPDTMPVRKYDLRHANGAEDDPQERYWSVVNSPVFDSNNEVVHIIHRLEDVTEYVRLEQQCKEQVEAGERKDRFLALFAHELRNPLGPILTGVHILFSSGDDPQVMERTRALVERQVRQLSRLLDDLLELSRILRGKVQLSKGRLDLARLARKAVEDRRPLLEQAGLSAVVDVPETPVWVLADSTRLAHLLNNLLDNAVQFSDGGKTVTIRVSADAIRQQAVLSVRDEGVGIEPERLPRLFEPFGLTEQSQERTGGGVGLGLALVKGLAELHGGQVEVASQGWGHGAEFIVRLPLEEPAVLSGIPHSGKPAPQPLRILVVEDNRDAADMLQLLLQLLGHEVRAAYTGPEGVRQASEWRPDIVLCDIGLPGLDGYGVAQELRRNPKTAQVRLIAVTGYGLEEDRRRSREVGFDAHLTKPADPDVLQQLLVRPRSAG